MCCPHILQFFVWTLLVNSLTWSYMEAKSCKDHWSTASPTNLLTARSAGASCSGLCSVRCCMCSRIETTDSQCTQSQSLLFPVKNILFHVFKWNFLYFQLMLIVSHSVTGLHQETFGSIFIHPHQEFVYFDETPLSLFCTVWTVPSLSLSLSS